MGPTELRRDMRVKVKSHVLLRIGRVRPVSGTAEGPWSSEHDRVYARAEERGWDATSQLEAMGAEGLDLAVLFPRCGTSPCIEPIFGPTVASIYGSAATFSPSARCGAAKSSNDQMTDHEQRLIL